MRSSRQEGGVHFYILPRNNVYRMELVAVGTVTRRGETKGKVQYFVENTTKAPVRDSVLHLTSQTFASRVTARESTALSNCPPPPPKNGKK